MLVKTKVPEKKIFRNLEKSDDILTSSHGLGQPRQSTLMMALTLIQVTTRLWCSRDPHGCMSEGTNTIRVSLCTSIQYPQRLIGGRSLSFEFPY